MLRMQKVWNSTGYLFRKIQTFGVKSLIFMVPVACCCFFFFFFFFFDFFFFLKIPVKTTIFFVNSLEVRAKIYLNKS